MNLLRHFKNAFLKYSRTYKIDGMNGYLAADPGVLANSGKLGGQTVWRWNLTCWPGARETHV
jgi:hypothetical protein